MVYAVFADVHANLEAFEAVADFCRRQAADGYFFAGDVVGYGADPEPCIGLLREIGAECVLGNHDAAALGMFDMSSFNEAAAQAAAWTVRVLSRESRRFLKTLPLTRTQPFFLAHGSPARPEEFGYVLSSHDALKAFFALPGRVCFVGHTHVPGVWVEEGDAIRFDRAAAQTLAPGRRTIVNVGSVGQPRDGDPRACVCLFDEGQGTLTLHRVAYDIEKAAGKIRAAGLPPVLADRLIEGR